jgi:hypothetical protein
MDYQRAFRAVYPLTTNAVGGTEDTTKILFPGDPNYIILYAWGVTLDYPYKGGGGSFITYDGGFITTGGILRVTLWDDAWINPDAPNPPNYWNPNPMIDAIAVSGANPSEFHSLYPQGNVREIPHSSDTSDWTWSAKYVSDLEEQDFLLTILWSETLA